MVRFMCWKCDAELAVVHNEYAAVSMWIQCPNSTCQTVNTVTYRFPEAKTEVQ